MSVVIHPESSEASSKGKKATMRNLQEGTNLAVIVSDTSRVCGQRIEAVLNSLAAVCPILFLGYLHLPYSLTLCLPIALLCVSHQKLLFLTVFLSAVLSMI